MAARPSLVRKSAEIARSIQDASVAAYALSTSAAAMVLGIVAGEASSAAPPVRDDGDNVMPQQQPAAADPVFHFAPFSAAAARAAADHQFEPHHDVSAPLSHQQPEQDQAPPVADTADAGRHDAPLSDAADFAAPNGPASPADPPGTGLAPPTDASAPGDTWLDIRAMMHDIGSGVGATIDQSLGALSANINGLWDTLQVPAAPDLAALTSLSDTISATAATLTQSAMAAPSALAGSLVTGLFESGYHPDQPAASNAFDAGALIPLSAPLVPLPIGFAGQPQIDGHDAHDGAFSALGLHHF